MSKIPEMMGGRRLEHGITVETGSISVQAGSVTAASGVVDQAGNFVNVEALTGTKTLTTTSAKFQKLDPGAGHRDVNLPDEASSKGLFFRITNGGAGNNLVVKDDSPATIATLNQNEAAWFGCDGTTWTHMGIETIALA